MDGFGRIEVKTLADHAYEQIEAAIMRGELAPGSRVSDFALARRLGISRGPIREAIQRLEGRKLVRRVPHVGVTVVAPSWDGLVEVFVVREALEGMACRLAAERLTPDEVHDLETLLGRAREDRNSGLDFHFRVVRGSRNERLMDLLGDELSYLFRFFRHQTEAMPRRPEDVVDEHRAILEALRRHDADEAERLMRAHIARTRGILDGRRRTGEPLAGAPRGDGTAR